MMDREDKEAWGGLGAVGPEGLVFLMLGLVLGAIAAALSFVLGRRDS
jgi:hypothetical protein